MIKAVPFCGTAFFIFSLIMFSLIMKRNRLTFTGKYR